MGIFVQTVLKLMIDNLTNVQHYLWTSKRKYNLNSQRENKPRPSILII